MAYSGKYKPENPQKYRGNPTNVIYRSLWERKFMVFCDRNPNIIQWGSEEVVIPYRSPLDGRVHRYFVDFNIKIRTRDGEIKKYLIEIKPKKQTIPPPNTSRKTKTWRDKSMTFIKNQAKWEAAKDWCEDRQMQFMILTEDHLGI
jgi:hypothetical protein